MSGREGWLRLVLLSEPSVEGLLRTFEHSQSWFDF